MFAGTAVVLTASVAAPQGFPAAEEQDAFAAVARAEEALDRAGSPEEVLRAAEQALAAAERARNAFVAADRRREAAEARYEAEYIESVARNWSCPDWGDPCAGVLFEQYAVDSTADAEYADVLGADAEAREARALAGRYRRYADRGRRHGLHSVEQSAANDDVGSSDALHARLRRRHQAANRAALDYVGRAAQTTSAAADRLVAGRDPAGAAVVRATEAAVAAAAAREVSEDGVRTDAALRAVLDAARRTLTALRTHVAAVEDASGTYEDPSSTGNDAGGGVPALEQATVDTFEGWLHALNAAVAEAEQVARETDGAARRGRLLLSAACRNAEDRMARAIDRVRNLAFGEDRPGFVPASAGAAIYDKLRERLDAARERARRTCAPVDFRR